MNILTGDVTYAFKTRGLHPRPDLRTCLNLHQFPHGLELLENGLQRRLAVTSTAVWSNWRIHHWKFSWARKKRMTDAKQQQDYKQPKKKKRKGPWQASEACAVNCEVVPEEHVPQYMYLSNLDSLNFGVWLRLIIQASLLSGACCVSGGRACVNGHTQFTVTAGLPTDTPVHLR